MKAAFFANSLVLLALVTFSAFGQSDDETAAKAAEQAGRYQDAIQRYTAALTKAQEGSADDQRLREAILRVAQRLMPAPVIPEEAKRYSVRGTVAIKDARSRADFEDAAREFGMAARAAPWWADAYFNQGVAFEKAGNYDGAIRNLKLYLLAAPRAKDADKVREQVYALEYRQEKAGKEDDKKRQEQDAKAGAEAEKKARASSLEGNWRDSTGSHYLFKVDGNSFTMTRVMDCWNPSAQPFGKCLDLRPGNNTLVQFGTITNSLLSGHSVNTMAHRTRRRLYPDGRSIACPIAAGNFPITSSEISADGTQIKIIAEDTTQNPDCPSWDHGRTYRKVQ